MTQNVLFCLLSLLPRSPLFCSDFRQLPCRCLFKFITFFIHRCLRIWYFHCLRHRNIFVHKIVVVQRTHSFPCNMIFMTFMKSSVHTLPRRFVGFNNACVFCLTFSETLQVSLYSSRRLLQGIALRASERPTFCAHFSKSPRILRPRDQ